MQGVRVLLIEDSEDDAFLLLRELKRGGFDPITYDRVDTEPTFRAALEREWDIIISDYSMPLFDPLSALKILLERDIDTPVIIVSGSVGEQTILAAMRAGASDYLMKDNLTRLPSAVERELRESRGRRERRSLQQQLWQAQRMEAVGRLAAGVAHDFNNLLTIISGYSELMLSKSDLSEPDRAALDEIRKAGERGSGLTRQLLAFSRKQTLEPRVVRINDLLLQMEKMLRRLIGEDIDLITIPAADPGVTRTDPGQFEQVIMNIVVNARDAMPDGGKVTIESTNVELDAEFSRRHIDLNPGAYVLVAITDTGTGMDAKTLSHVFEPFFTTKELGKGTGLGMATAYGIIKQSGGSILIESEIGRGTVVRIYLPAVDALHFPSEEAEKHPAALHGNETVLVVEDEGRVRKLISDVLTSHGYRVVEAARGPEALQYIQKHPGAVDILLSDVIMPEMNGPELLKQVAAREPRIRALYMSGYTDEAITHHNIAESGIAFLQKPFLPDALLRKVREVLDSRRRSAGS